MGGGTATLRALIREYLFVSLFRACAESLASENASRLAAMQRADKNIDELLEDLNGTFHRLRQSGIDEELFDVISGFEALGAGGQMTLKELLLAPIILRVRGPSSIRYAACRSNGDTAHPEQHSGKSHHPSSLVHQASESDAESLSTAECHSPS